MSCDFTITLLLNIHSAGPSLGHFVSELVLHWVQGRCIALRNVRTLGDFSATVVLRHYCHGRTLPTASGTLQLEKSVISCSTAPQLHSSRLLSNSKAPTSLLAAQFQAEHPADVHRSAFNLISVALCPEFLEPRTSILLALLDLACSIELGLREKIRISQLTTY